MNFSVRGSGTSGYIQKSRASRVRRADHGKSLDPHIVYVNDEFIKLKKLQQIESHIYDIEQELESEGVPKDEILNRTLKIRTQMRDKLNESMHEEKANMQGIPQKMQATTADFSVIKQLE
ncbi:hypothetical protein PCE1_003337 [Barthelona sp. PCE]